jgi:hypothetical protein
VGAAIAAGSQDENGICALLVNPANIISVIILSMFILSINVKKFHDPKFNIQAILIKIATSPIRFINIVNIPALLEDKF